MLYMRQAKEADKPAIEATYGKGVRYSDAHGIHQWNLDGVSWETSPELYSIADYHVGTVNEKVTCSLSIVGEDTLYWSDMEKGTSLYLHKICVDPTYSGNGYADTMIRYFIEEGHREGHPDVRLDACEHKDKLRRVYKRNGFQLYRTE